MTRKDMIDIIERLNERRSKLWKLLVGDNISDTFAKTIKTELQQLDNRLFTIRCKLLSVED